MPAATEPPTVPPAEPADRPAGPPPGQPEPRAAAPDAALPESHPYHLRAPKGAHLRRRTTQTLQVARRRLGPLAAKRAIGRPVEPVEVARPLRKAFSDLGATYVKLGQLMASAPSVFGEDVSTEFRSLLDSGRPVGFDRIRHEIERATGAPLDATFREVDPDPIGRASMAVVHRAQLRSGEWVAVKVLRPGIERKIAADFSLMSWLLPRIASRIDGAQPELVPPMLAGLREQICEELDLRNEAQVMTHFRGLLAEVDLPGIVIPVVHPELSSRRVLVMELLDGVAIDDIEAIEAFGFDPTPLVNDIVKAFFLTTVRWGIFHGDVHAGNLLLLRDGRMGILDWGIVGHLDEADRAHVRAIIRAALGDEAAWVEVTDRITEQIGPMIVDRLGITEDQIAPMVRLVLEPMFTLPFGEVKLSTLVLGPDELTGGVEGLDTGTGSGAGVFGGGASSARRGTGRGGPARGGATGSRGKAVEPPEFDRSMLLLAKQLLYFERYGQLYLRETSLFHDRAFFEALVADSA